MKVARRAPGTPDIGRHRDTHPLGRRHIEGVDVGSLFAIDLMGMKIG